MTTLAPINTEQKNTEQREVPYSGHHFNNSRHWAASLTLGFDTRTEADTSITRLKTARHFGPLRVQRPFYPEGRDGCCHVYVLHPPGGLVSGDELIIDVTVDKGAHALVTTPAANKLYKADRNDVKWHQVTSLTVADGGTLEWIPQESLAFDSTRGEQVFKIELGDNAKCLGWEVLCLGRPASNLPFIKGHLEQRFELRRNGRPLWLERQTIDPNHPRFLGKWGQAGATVHATLWTVGLNDPEATILALREHLPATNNWAVTYRREVLLLRYIGNERNEAWQLFEKAREVIRPLLTGHEATTPRIWFT